MPVFANPLPALTRGPSRLGRLCAILFFCLCGISRAHAGATLFLEEPYSYDGTFAGTVHVAVYLSNVCSVSPVLVRRCAEGESGVVFCLCGISRANAGATLFLEEPYSYDG